MSEASLFFVALPYLMQAAAGGIGGNIAGMLRRTQAWGPLFNTLLGAAGGVIGAQALHASGQAGAAAGAFGANLAALEATLAVISGAGVALASSAFKQPD
jgi:hypothetical protein